MSISDDDYREHMETVMREGFTLSPPGYERLTQWTHLLMHIVNARHNFERVRDHAGVKTGELADFFDQQAFFVAGVMAYCRCYAASGAQISKLDAKQVYAGSDQGKAVHERLIELRNRVAAHTDHSDLIQLTLAVKEGAEEITVRHLSTTVTPINEISDFLEAVAHSEHFVILSINKLLDHLGTKVGKKIILD
ncbi:hypothetical protein [Caulobacter sp. BE254]|uniref:hypothetical protein n=1 Tax=Caulobacter sp. BE254 TaxID=2817720 RepID=UPI0028604ECB|nr:hypothetical protein [Caulobacter sp. BE254]MDR7117381.1 hypothetical protein [Caulobacter sp. BE254]